MSTVAEGNNSKASETQSYAGNALTFRQDFDRYILELEKLVNRELSTDAVEVYVSFDANDGFVDL